MRFGHDYLRKQTDRTKTISVYSDRVDQVISVCYLKSTEDLLYIYSSGGIEQTNMIMDLKISMAQIFPKRYFKILVSKCDRFISLQSEDDIYLFNIVMDLISSDKSVPVHYTVTDSSWVLYYVNEDKFEYKEIDLLKPKIGPNVPQSSDFERKIYYQTKCILELGSDLIKELFQRRSQDVIEKQYPNSLLKVLFLSSVLNK